MIFSFLFRIRYRLVAFALATLWALWVTPGAKAEALEGALVAQPVAPTLESLDRPNQTYHPGEVISYQIRVRWSAEPSNGIRMIPPDLTLENLELLNISQETVSGSENQEKADGIEQILSFRFMAKRPGPATVDRFSLRWVQGDGVMASALSVPSLELTITPRPRPWLWITLMGGGLFGGLASILFVSFVHKRKRKDLLNAPSKSLEERALDELRNIHVVLRSNETRQDVLSSLMHIFQHYCSQKFDWNPARDGYNALQKKAEERWPKKEVHELSELFQTFEHKRFSGEQVEQAKLESLYQALYSFIEHKKII